MTDQIRQTQLPQSSRPQSSRLQPFLWLVRRELWEHPALYVAPLGAAGVALLGFLASLIRLPHAAVSIAEGAPVKGAVGLIQAPYSFVALAVMLVGLLVSLFYALAALQNERRDRSIQFWKSLPVSDAQTVLAKAAVPMVLMPVIIFAVTAAAHTAMLLVSTVLALANGIDPGVIWSRTGVELMWIVVPYGLVLNALWMAPVYGWLLLVSAWAKRATFVWALAPWLGMALFERLAFNSYHLIGYIGERLMGGFGEAFSKGGQGRAPVDSLADLDPLRFAANPQLWIGLAFCGLFLFAAVRLRRANDPI